jgi:hypothetical protein
LASRHEIRCISSIRCQSRTDGSASTCPSGVLSTLVEENRVVLGGPFTDDSGALIVYEADSPESVEMMIKGDPFFVAGVFQTWTIKPSKTVFANMGLLPPN